MVTLVRHDAVADSELGGSLGGCVRSAPNGGNEGQQVVEVVLEHVLDDPEVDLLVAVDQDIAEARHVSQGRRQFLREPSRLDEEVEEISVGLGFTQPLVRDDVRGDVQSGLDRDLKRVLDEALLPDSGLGPA